MELPIGPNKPERMHQVPAELFGGTLTVGQLTRLIRDAIRANLPARVAVIGEISNWRRHRSGVWFTLKDDNDPPAQLNCVMWTDRLLQLKFKPQDGLQVIARGQVDVYAPHGRYQLYVESLEPVGVGQWELAFKQLYERLSREGLFDARHKQPLPAFPQTIAIVTSPTGAAVRDIIRTILRRWRAIRLIVVPVRVQGDGAAEEIAEAIRTVNHLRERLGGVDLLIVGRGGGSIEDLWAFNEEIVARAIFASRIPVISAVGHERDQTIADFVADARAATPTHAGEMAVRLLDEVLADLARLQASLTSRIQQTLETCRLKLQAAERVGWFAEPVEQVRRYGLLIDEAARGLGDAVQEVLRRHRTRLEDATLRLQTCRPDVQLAKFRTRLDETAGRLLRAMKSYNNSLAGRLSVAEASLRASAPHRQISLRLGELERAHLRMNHLVRRFLQSQIERLENWRSRLEASSHQQVLKRGYTITRDARTGKIITSVSQIRAGQRISTETADGRFTSRVEPDGRDRQLDLPLS